MLSFLLLATQNTNVENICGTEGAKAKGRKEYTVETDVSPQTDWGSSCTVQVYSSVLYKCIVVMLELWRFQLDAKNNLL